jgi:hypothetical protein
MRNHDDYWRRLATDPDFEAEMSERQRQLGQLAGMDVGASVAEASYWRGGHSPGTEARDRLHGAYRLR